MKLLLNAEALRPPLTGIGNYTLHLLRQFLGTREIEAVRCFTGTGWWAGNDQLTATTAVELAGGQQNATATSRAVAQLRQAVGMIPGTHYLYDTLMNRRFEQGASALPGAVYHETNYILKPYAGPCVTTVHDLSHLRFPEFHPDNVVRHLTQHLPETLQRADRVITVSDVVRNELLEYFDLAPEKVCTVYEGVESAYLPRTAEQTSATLSSYGLEHAQYVLLVATLEPRKGISVLLDAWSRLPLSLRREFPLVMTGSAGWRNSDLMKRIESFREEGSVRHLGYVPSEVLPVLFSGAAVFSYPSVYEGFGLPALEAMSSAVPVVCRAGTSMAEFARGACLLCETDTAEELAAKLEMLLMDEGARLEWGRKGRARSTDFSWERCAAETVEIYRELS